MLDMAVASPQNLLTPGIYHTTIIRICCQNTNVSHEQKHLGNDRSCREDCQYVQVNRKATTNLMTTHYYKVIFVCALISEKTGLE